VVVMLVLNQEDQPRTRRRLRSYTRSYGSFWFEVLKETVCSKNDWSKPPCPNGVQNSRWRSTGRVTLAAFGSAAKMNLQWPCRKIHVMVGCAHLLQKKKKDVGRNKTASSHTNDRTFLRKISNCTKWRVESQTQEIWGTEAKLRWEVWGRIPQKLKLFRYARV